MHLITLQPTTYGVQPSGEAIPERRCGPRCLRVDDDDDDRIYKSVEGNRQIEEADLESVITVILCLPISQ